MAKLRAFSALLVFAVLVTISSVGQDQSYGYTIYHPNQEIRIKNLSLGEAVSRSTVLAAELEAVFHDKDLCCAKNSALEDIALYSSLAAPVSLKEISGKLQGRHLLPDGRSFQVNTEYAAPDTINSGAIVNALRNQNPPILEWKSHFYLVYGAVYNEALDSSGTGTSYSITKLLLLDGRYSDQRRETEFDRDTEDWSKVQGLLTLTVSRPQD